MTTNRRICSPEVVIALPELIPESTTLNAEDIKRFHTVSGIVGYAHENTLSIKNKPYNIAGTPFFFIHTTDSKKQHRRKEA